MALLPLDTAPLALMGAALVFSSMMVFAMRW